MSQSPASQWQANDTEYRYKRDKELKRIRKQCIPEEYKPEWTHASFKLRSSKNANHLGDVSAVFVPEALCVFTWYLLSFPLYFLSVVESTFLVRHRGPGFIKDSLGVQPYLKHFYVNHVSS